MAIEPGMTVIVFDRDAQRQSFVRAVKAEAHRRILAVMPEWRQRNAIAWTLQTILTHGADRSSWPREMQAEQSNLDRAWGQINAIRERSSALESGDVIPAKILTSDGIWP